MHIHVLLIFGFTYFGHKIVKAQSDVNLQSLVLVQSIFRHGDRNPEYAYPKDPYQSESLWPGGWGQLTHKGRKQTYNLGRYYRMRYDGFIGRSPITNEVHTLSSDKTRSILSGLLVLAGLYPSEGINVWNEKVNWEPAPIRTIPQSQDNMLWMSKPCPKYWKDFNDFMYNSDVMKTINSRNQDLYLFLTEKTGVNVSHINHLYKFYSTLKIEQLYGLTLPPWAPQIIESDGFNYLYNLSMKTLTYTTEFKRLRAGPLLNYIVENIKNKLDNGHMKVTKEKLFLLSAHDITISQLLDSLGVFDLQIPGYASSVIIECHRNLSASSNSYYINVLFRNDTSREPYMLKIPGCEHDCPLEAFFKWTNPLIPLNWDEECSIEEKPVKKYFINGEILASVLGSLVIIFLIIIILVVIINKRKRSTGSNNNQRRHYI